MSRCVFLQQGGELEQSQLLQQVHLKHRLGAELQGRRGKAGTVGVLEAWPAQFGGPLREGGGGGHEHQGTTARDRTDGFDVCTGH